VKGFHPLLVPALGAVALLSGCAMNSYTARRPAPPAPCSTPVSPIRYNSMAIVATSNLTYTAKDESAARSSVPDMAVDRLNADGRADGNTFSVANGTAVNFYLAYTVNNDGNNRFSGSVRMSGWGQGYIATLSNGQYAYSNAPDMIRALTDSAYGYIHNGWHDSRPQCPQR
jgi:hypothetical protein